MGKFCRRLFITVVILWSILPGTQAAAAQSVTVKLADFPITLNSLPVNNAYRAYPFIVYQGVTYCPLTYSDSRLLGVETNWNDEGGLTIDNTSVICGFQEILSNKRQAETATAHIADFTITINGQLLDNSSERYPFLVIHDVTYLPLSWHFVHDIFDWTYHYDNVKGMSIQTKNALMLPQAIPHFNNNSPHNPTPNIMLDKGQLYFEGEDGGIYRVSLDDLGSPQKLLQKKREESEFDGPFYWSTQLKNLDKYVWAVNQGVLIDKQTAAIKKVNDDGLESVGYPYCDINVAAFEDKLFYADGRRLDPNDGQHIDPGNLYMEQKGKRTAIGDKRYIYGQVSYIYGLSPTEKIDYVDGSIYICAAKLGYPEERSGTLCQVDINTNKTTELYHTNGDEIQEWVIDGDMLYYLVANGKDDMERVNKTLYTRSLKDGTTSKAALPENMTSVTQLKKIGHTIYFWGRDTDDGLRTLKEPEYCLDLYGFRQYDSLQDKQLRWINQQTAIEESNGYMIYCMLERMGREPRIDYRTLIFDPDGQLVFKSADIVDKVSVDQQGNVAYTIQGQPNIYFGHIEQ